MNVTFLHHRGAAGLTTRPGWVGIGLLAALSLLWLTGCGGGASADEAAAAPSALVHVIALQRGTLPRVVTVYGTAQGSVRSRQTIMAPAAAQVGAVEVRLGESVKDGQALLKLSPTPALAASYAQARSALSVADELVTHTRALLEQRLATMQQLNDAMKSEADARAALAALQAQGASGLTVRAPFAATVTALSASVGMLVNEGTPLLDLARMKGLVVQAGAVPELARTINVGDKAQIAPIGASGALQGEVALRGAVVDPMTGLVPIEISLPPGAMLPGEQAVARITAGEAQGYVVPHAAVLIDDEGNPYVVQVIDGTAKKVSVSVLSNDGRDAISGPLTPSAPIVLEGNYQLENGMKVRVANASMPAVAQ